jgi:uncharacterized membrane protein
VKVPIVRIVRHVFATRFMTRRRFPREVCARIEAKIREVERLHAGEIRFAVETALELPDLWRGLTPRQRALEVFGLLGIWDTAANNGVLVYLLMADRDVEIVADRGIAGRVPQAEWDAAARAMEDKFRAGRYAEGAVAGIGAIGDMLARHFPGGRGDRDEQPDEIVLM